MTSCRQISLAAVVVFACSDPTAPDDDSVRAVVAGSGFSCALLGEAAYCWGQNDVGQLGREQAGADADPAPVAGGHRFRTLAAGERNVCGIADDGVYCWGYLTLLGTQGGSSPVPTRISMPSASLRFTAIDVGAIHACALTQAGQAYCWGFNQHGEVGSGATSASQLDGTPVVGGHTFTQISAGAFHSCGLAGGELWCWGYNFDRSMGNGVAQGASVPTPIRVDLPFTPSAVTAGSGFTCALDGSSLLWCWGLNIAGQLGRGTFGSSDGIPARAGIDIPLAEVFAIGANRIDTHACARAEDGVWCWGASASARLGHASTQSCGTAAFLACWPSPTAIADPRSFEIVAVGFDHTCGVASDDSIWCWGSNAHRQLGGGAAAESLQPVRITIVE